ncbi:MAG: hypothetical protein CMF12_06925 [Idiomarina sp.]|uniref:hypothetical protein n=1 Tax=Idiomarina sp. TaxID=1874361 RepID=UPI000C472B83|nr:hypothetical protein [Idiomarina sp.]MBT42243.1 hypothetical protein [Idiomarina sp.]
MTKSTAAFHIERYQNGNLIGWAFDKSKPEKSLSIKVYVNGQLFTESSADIKRDDLKEAGMGNGQHAFKIPVRELTATAGEYTFTLKDPQDNDMQGDAFVVRVHEDFAAAGKGALAQDTKETLAAIKVEQQRLNEELFAAIEEAANPHQHLEIVIQHLTSSLARLNVSATALENIVAADKAEVKAPAELSSSASDSNVMKLKDSLLLDASHFEEVDNFYSLEKNKDNKPYRWTGPEAVNTFLLPVSRDNKRTLKIRLFSTVDADVLKALKIEADGKELPHETAYEGNTIVLTSALEKQEKSGSTQVKLKLAKTISPEQLGTSNDKRLLGVAFNSVEIV